MLKKPTKTSRFFLSILFFCCLSANIHAQINVKVQVVRVSSTLDDCDFGVNVPFIGIVGDSGSDPLFSWSGSVVNNNCYAMPQCNNTGSPAGCTQLGTIDIRNQNLYLYDENFACPTNFPLTIPWNFEGRENDTPTNCVLGSPASIQSAIAAAAHSVLVPAAANTFTQSFTVASTGSCAGDFVYEVEVRVTGVFPPAVPDAICDAVDIPVDGQYHNYAWCGNYTSEVGEFDMTSPGWLGDAFGSGWFRFIAPASGSVSINTSGSQTTLGTAFIVYHAADGAGCSVAGTPGHGVSASGVTLKRKFQYLSSYDDADDDIFLINPQGKADIDLNSCSNILSDGHDLVAGETYYIQLTTDRASDVGNIGIKITDLGGSGSNGSDIPCQAPSAGVLTTSNWNRTNSYGCSTSYEFTGNSGTSAYNYLDPAGGSNNVNQTSWVAFTAPTSGAAFAETNVSLFGENNALYAYDNRFAPGRPADYSCANLTQTPYNGNSALFGGNAQFTARCLEPGYTYYVVGDPATVNLNLSSTLDFTLRDPGNIAPANDILCLTLPNPTFRVPVQLLGQPALTPVGGNNTNACIERLAGEPGFQNAADKTVWHYFTAPPSGVVNVTVTALTIGQVSFATYHALNGTSCYGGLAPATFTTDGTPSTPRLTALGSATGGGAVVSQICCLVPGDMYVIEVDGGTTISEGTYNVRVQEVDVQAGATQYVDGDGDTYNIASASPALICANESITVGSTNAILPAGGCLAEGYLLHNNPTPTLPYNLTIYQQATPTNYFFVNNGTAPYNQRLYVSALADNAATWGQRCASARIKDAVPVVFLQPIVFGTPVVTACGGVRVSVSGGLPAYDASTFTYTISPANQVSPIASGTVGNGGFISFTGIQSGNYTIFVNDGEGCSRSKTINIPSIATVTATVSGAMSFCVNNPVNLTATGGTFYDWTLPDGSPSSGSPLVATQGGTYTVTVTNAAGCTATATHFINVLPAAPPVTITPVTPLCTVGNALLSAGAGYTNYAWNTTTATTATISAATAGIYTVTATNSAGCTTTASLTLSLNSNPANPVISGSTLICGNGFTTLDAGTATTYSWSNTQNTQQINVTTSGSYTVTITNIVGCTATASASVTASALPAAPVLTQNGPLCSNAPTTVSAQTGYNTYAWNTGATTSTISILPANAGSYTLTVTNTAGCAISTTIPIAQVAAPTLPTMNLRDSLCSNSAAVIEAIGSNYTAYLWNTTATTSSIQPTTTGRFTVTVTNAAGCKNTNSVVLSQQAAPALPTISQTGILCSNNGVTLTANSTTSGVTYAWNNGATTATTTVAANTNTTFTVTVTSAAGCKSTTQQAVSAIAAPAQPIISTPINLCSNSAGLISVPTGTAPTYLWSGGSTANSQVIPIGAVGVYTVTITAASGCTNTNSINIAALLPPASPQIVPSSLFCAGKTATITAASGYASYFWNSSNNTPTLTISTNGIYTVTVTNVAGCSTIGTINAIANAVPLAPTIAQSQPLCVAKTTTLTASGGYAAYTWGVTSNGQAITVNATGVYTVTVTDNIGCTNSRTITVTQELPTFVSLQGANYFCRNAQTNLATSSNFTSYTWNTAATTRSINIAQAGTYEVTATASNGCTGTARETVTERNLPNANAGNNQAIYLGQTAMLDASGGSSYIWTPTTAFTDPTNAMQTVAPQKTTVYYVLVTDSYGCAQADSVQIEVYDYLECLRVDEGVTPNGDGKNDTWSIPCIDNFENTLEIYNRWGELLYSVANYKQDWNGIYNGQTLPDGTYYYVIRIKTDNPRKLYKGTITVLR